MKERNKQNFNKIDFESIKKDVQKHIEESNV